jgi:ribosomal protein L29
VSKIATNLQTLRDQTDDELKTQLANTRDELFRLQLGQYTNQVTSTAAITTKRRDVARILTILNGRKGGLETQAQKSTTTETSTEAAPAKTKTAKKKTSKS